ncbi:hypothetical protein LTR36_003613 [Oleoguttula mirabilis]|uniref:Uncharacterized protein n=1 Tax=Oleoguttula mirabilis TaxID=1507867 RepID=A0AAV9JJB7_9PEZI|nr:hypothetical protein LTR36_003613 [Oleoguttula mirabilis]
MAFQQPRQRPQAARQVSFSTQTAEQQVPASPARKRHLEESQEWILFSPAPNTDGQSQTTRTATDFGSLETHVRSQTAADSAEEATCLGTDTDDENAELDSLDDGLHAFHHHPFSSSSNQLDQSGGTVLPTHDGLGAFSSGGLQEQLWQFERYNPHRRRVRRRSSIQKRLDEVEEEVEVDLADERTARVEKWRLEQSRAVLEEIERETRRRRRRMSRMSGASASGDIRTDTHQTETVAGARADAFIQGEPETVQRAEQQQPGESWWQRLTRRVIQDLIGLDENTLSVIFGEQLPEDPSPTPTQPSPLATAAQQESRVAFRDREYDWETKLLERIARELGVLVHQLSEHEGAFSTYQRVQEEPEYAGLPMPGATQIRPSPQQQRRRRSSNNVQTAPSDALFTPTLAQAPVSPGEQTDTSLWGIEEEPSQPSRDEEGARLRQDQEYWERDVDVNMIFSYLRRRFSSNTPPPQPTAAGPLPASWATNSASVFGSSPESLRRAEVIRRQHPLVSRAAERAAAHHKRQESLLRRHQMQSLLQKRPGGSSCASQSTKRSRRSKSGSSRNYWDLGGSVGSVGSGPAMSSGLGGWGEV